MSCGSTLLSLVTKDGAARHDAQSRNLREVVDETLGETVAEVIELCVAAAIHQRKHGKRLNHVARATAARSSSLLLQLRDGVGRDRHRRLDGAGGWCHTGVR